MSVKIFLGFLLVASSLCINLYDDASFVYVVSEELKAENKDSVEGCKLARAHWDFLKIDTDQKIFIDFKTASDGNVDFKESGSAIPDINTQFLGAKFQDLCKVDITLTDSNGASISGAELCWVKYNDQVTVQLCEGNTPKNVGCTVPQITSPADFTGIDNSITVKIGTFSGEIASSASVNTGSGDIDNNVKDACKVEVKITDQTRLSIV